MYISVSDWMWPINVYVKQETSHKSINYQNCKLVWKNFMSTYLREADPGADLYLADVTLSSNRLPPLLTDSQFLVRVYVSTSSGRTGIELTRLMDGKKENVSFSDVSPVIQRLESRTVGVWLKQPGKNVIYTTGVKQQSLSSAIWGQRVKVLRCSILTSFERA